MKRTCIAAVLAVLAAFSCRSGDSEPVAPTAEPGGDPVAGGDAARNLETLRRYLDVFESKDYDGVRALFSPDFRLWHGPKFGSETSRAEILDGFVENWKKGVNHKRPQLVLADDRHGLVFSIVSIAFGPRLVGPHPRIQVFGFVGDKIASRASWFDQMSVYHSAGVPNSAGGPENEQPWPERIDVFASGDEREATQVARARDLLGAIERRDPTAAAELVADGFIDRDLTEKEPETYATPNDFESAVRSWLELSDVSVVRILDVWSAGPYVVATFSRSYRLSADLPQYPGTTGNSAQAYHLWLLQFDGDGKLAARWRMRERLTELIQTGAVDLRGYFAERNRALAPK